MPSRPDGDDITVTVVLRKRQWRRVRALAELQQLPDEKAPNYSRTMRGVVDAGLGALARANGSLPREHALATDEVHS